MNFSELIVSNQRRYTPKKGNIIVEGIDTETKKGYARIIADSSQYAEINSIEDVFEFLTNRQKRGKANFFFNLKYDVECMLKWKLGILKQLVRSNKATYKQYAIFYIPGKVFKISAPGKNVYSYYDIAQFFHVSLENASNEILKEKVSELKGDRAKLFELHTKEEIGKYCVEDARHTKMLAEWYIEQLAAIDFYPQKLLSAGNLAGQYMLMKSEMPLIQYVPYEVQKSYWTGYKGGWFELAKRGMHKSYSYDIVSAYPAVMRDLPDIRDGVWFHELLEDSRLGIIKVRIKGGNGLINPISIHNNNVSTYPYLDKSIEAFMTLTEFKAYEKHYKTEVLDAWSFKELPKVRYPFRSVVDTLFSLKQNNKGNKGLYTTSKEIINSLYGKSVEKYKDEKGWHTGNFFNPVYGAETTAKVRTQLYEAVRGHEKEVIMLATDSIHTTRKFNLRLSHELGNWDVEQENTPTVYFLSGIYQASGKKPRTRGLHNIKNLVDRLNVDSTTAIIRTTRPLHYKECFIQNRENEIGQFKIVEKKMSMLGDHKRLWLSQPEKMRDLLNHKYDSVSLPVSILKT